MSHILHGAWIGFEWWFTICLILCAAFGIVALWDEITGWREKRRVERKKFERHLDAWHSPVLAQKVARIRALIAEKEATRELRAELEDEAEFIYRMRDMP